MDDRVYELLTQRPVIIGHCLGFQDLTMLHNSWLIEWLYGTEDVTVQAHRESYKTTALALFIALYVLIHRDKNLIFLRKTDADVSEIIRLIAKIIGSGVYSSLSMELWNTTPALTKETASEIHTNLYRGKTGASQIVGMGINGSLTGKHADIIITDDIVNIKDRISKAERDHTKLIYQELQNVKKRSGRIINTGTVWHKDDAFSLMPNIKQYNCYVTGLMTPSQIQDLRNKMTASLFSANYELKIVADEDALVKDAQFTKDVQSIYNGICHIDASYGGADSTAFTILAEKDDHLIVYGKKYRKHVNDCLADIFSLKTKYLAGTTYCERNADKGYLAQELQSQGDVVKTYHEKMNKHIKIANYIKANWHRILFLEDTDPEYLNEILDYTEHAQHDDCPDSLASAIRQISKKPLILNRHVTTGI